MTPEIKNILEIIDKKDFLKFIDMKENQYFEAKNGNPYDFGDPNDRYELAKDVSSFANMEGGYLIIGLKTKRLDSEKTDIVTSLDLIKKVDFEEGKFSGVIKEYIYPQIDGLEIKWVGDKGNPGQGIVYIFIPKQNNDKKLFLIKNIIEEGKKLKEIVFGIARRDISSNQPLTIYQLYEKIKYGMSTNSVKLRRIEEKIDVVIKSTAEKEEKAQDKLLEKRISNIINIED